MTLYVGAVFDFGHVAACSCAVVNTLCISEVNKVEYLQGHSVFSSLLLYQSHHLSANYNLQYTNTNEKQSNIPRFTFRPTIDMASPYKG